MIGGSAKFRPPRKPQHAVEMPDLAARLEEADGLLICTILTAAGYGKTTALTQHMLRMKKCGKTVAWVSLEESDQDPSSFLESIFASFELADEHIGKAALTIVRSGGLETAKTALATMFDEIAELPNGASLILDDYHIVENSEINGIVELLLDLAPDNFSLKIASRFVPNLDLTSHKVRGLLAEFRTEDLRFGQQVSRQFLEEFTNVPISEEQFKAISRYAGGWALGLQVAAISIKQMGGAARFLDRLAKSKSDVSDFLASDVVADLEQPVRTFLAETAHLGNFSAELCDEVIGSNNSRDMIETLARLNLFIEPIGSEDGWYRYHAFFRDFLRQRIANDDPEYVREFNRKSYMWFSRKGLYEHSIFHALKAQMWAEAADGLEAYWKQMLTDNQIDRLQGWLGKLPPDMISERPYLQIALAWTQILQRNTAEAKSLVGKLQKKLGLNRADFSPPKIPADPLLLDMFVLQIATDNICDDVSQIAKLASLDHVDFAHLEPFQRGLSLNCIIYAQVVAGKFDKAHRLAEVALEIQRDSDLILIKIHGELFRGFAYQICGDLNAAHSVFLSAHSLAMQNFNYPYSAPQSLLASIYYEWNRIEAASDAIYQSENAINAPSVLAPVIEHYITSARIAAFKGDESRAFSILAEAEVVGRKDGNSRLLIITLAERIRLHLSNANLSEAKDIERELIELCEPHRKLDHFVWPRAQSMLAQASSAIKIAEEKGEQAREIIRPYIVEAEASSRDGILVKFLILDALALDQMGKSKEAHRKLAHALAVGQKGNFLRIFADQLEYKHSLVAGALNQAKLNGQDQSYLAAVASAVKISSGDWIKRPDYQIDEYLAESLTQREKELLLALSAGQTNKQIARDLDISDNTVAWHLKNLFSKLNVNNRTEAANAARHSGLVK